MRFVFIMDPLDRVTHDKDTTFAFIQAAQERGHESHHCLLRDLYIDDGDAWAVTHPVQTLAGPPWILLEKTRGPARIRLADVDGPDDERLALDDAGTGDQEERPIGADLERGELHAVARAGCSDSR